MAYVGHFAAIALEVFATSMLKSTNGFTRLLPTLRCLAGYAASFAVVAQVVQKLPVGIVSMTRATHCLTSSRTSCARTSLAGSRASSARTEAPPTFDAALFWAC